MSDSTELDALRTRLETGELADLPDPARILSSETVFDGHIWDVKRERFAFGDGELTREFVAHTGAVAVLALDEQDGVLLINQYRHPIRTRDWELPAGLLDIEGEDPQTAAARELAEETDLAAAEWEPLATFHTTPGGSDELLRVYLARGLSSVEAFDRGEEEAQIVRRWVALDEVVAAVLAGRLSNSILQIAVLTAHARRG
ncbi:NUDIX hydrolase [Schumannella luteola]|uniref:ADP-ribose pyrophosphatase n=1 Tax=Schumannella luteola TaxID=472059 RepID=A0A852YGA4_9MICO|nr:NUDIX hydrolase [Schumannella luteola]NYH00783.1 ADP-ribose pyrophosphatase [Schumannella luteola]TPX02288.1 NUDIX hydrolase [Schumannella luteola]